MVSRTGCMSTGWMSLRHLEGMIFIHLKRDYSFPFVSELYIIIFDQCLFSSSKCHTHGHGNNCFISKLVSWLMFISSMIRDSGKWPITTYLIHLMVIKQLLGAMSHQWKADDLPDPCDVYVLHGSGDWFGVRHVEFASHTAGFIVIKKCGHGYDFDQLLVVSEIEMFFCLY